MTDSRRMTVGDSNDVAADDDATAVVSAAEEVTALATSGEPVADSPVAEADGTPLATVVDDLDRVSLERALLDFEIANTRVVDLTRRLVEAGQEVLDLRREVEILRVEFEAARGSRAYRLANRARTVLRSIRP